MQSLVGTGIRSVVLSLVVAILPLGAAIACPQNGVVSGYQVLAELKNSAGFLCLEKYSNLFGLTQYTNQKHSDPTDVTTGMKRVMLKAVPKKAVAFPKNGVLTLAILFQDGRVREASDLFFENMNREIKGNMGEGISDINVEQSGVVALGDDGRLKGYDSSKDVITLVSKGTKWGVEGGGFVGWPRQYPFEVYRRSTSLRDNQ